MEVVRPMYAASMDCYEDMFKEITRKLYGEEGLPDIEGAGGGLVPPEYAAGAGGPGDGAPGVGGVGVGVGGVMPSVSAAAAASLTSDLAAAAHGVVGHGSGSGALTAFGLAALMQNGFPPPPSMLGAHHHHHLQEKYRASAAAAAAAAAMGYHHPAPHPSPHPVTHPVAHASPHPVSHASPHPPPHAAHQASQPPHPSHPSPHDPPVSMAGVAVPPPTIGPPSVSVASAIGGGSGSVGGVGPPSAGAPPPAPAPAPAQAPSSAQTGVPSGSAPTANTPGSTGGSAGGGSVGGGGGLISVAVGHGEGDRWMANEDQLPWTSSKIATYNVAQKLFRCADCECVGFLARVAEHWLGTHANLRVFQCPQCSYASAWSRCVRMHLTRQHNVPEDGASTAMLLKENPVLDEVTKYLQRLKNKVETCSPGTTKAPDFPPNHLSPRPGSGDSSGGSQNASNGGNRRYCCSYCPYSTDRRDLFTRHENIHREEKPFQCYVCQKQFNRADHVKKHFLRMHRDYPYDLNRIRRAPPKNGGMYYHKYNNNHISGSGTPNGVNRDSNTPTGGHGGMGTHMGPPGPMQQQQQHQQQQQQQPQQQHQQHQHHNQHHNLNIPSGYGRGNSSGNMGGGGVSIKYENKQQPQMQQQHMMNVNGCNNKSALGKSKKTAEKRYSCHYCAWSGVDNWCLKRHLNTHLKPFTCALCDYKAARSERLATHVLKVHNKRACGRCNFLADDQAQLSQHLQEHQHQGSGGAFPYGSPDGGSGLSGSGRSSSSRGGSGSRGGASARVVVKSEPHAKHAYGGRRMRNGQMYSTHAPSPRSPRTFGAARLFNYLEASDASDEGDGGMGGGGHDDEDEDMGDTDGMDGMDGDTHSEGVDVDDDSMSVPMPMDDDCEDPSSYVCHNCGCEFADDDSLETHRLAHHRLSGGYGYPTYGSYAGSSYGANSSAGQRTTRLRRVIRRRFVMAERVSKTPFTCSVCGKKVLTQTGMIQHMREHTGPVLFCRADDCEFSTSLGEASLREHVAKAHQNETPRCTHCGLTAAGDVLRRHMDIHHKAPVPPTTATTTPASDGGDGDEGGGGSSSSGIGSSNRRKQSQPRRLPPESDAPTVRVRRRVLVAKRRVRRRRRSASRSQSRSRALRGVRHGRVHRRAFHGAARTGARSGPPPGRRGRGRPRAQRTRVDPDIQRLRDKHAGALLARGRRRCPWCRHMHAVTFPYHTPASLGLHDLWRHRRDAFQCEHCDLRFRHRYQVVLHASREHVRANAPVEPAAIVVPVVPANVCEPILSVPELKHETPPIVCDIPSVPALPPPSFMHVPDSLVLLGDKAHMQKDVNMRDRPSPMEDSPTLNTPYPAPPPSVAPPPLPLPPASPPPAS